MVVALGKIYAIRVSICEAFMCVRERFVVLDFLRILIIAAGGADAG